MSDTEAVKLDPARTALIIQDLQNDVIIEGGAFADSGAPAHATSQGVVQNVKGLAEACRAAGVPVIHIWYIVEPGAAGLRQNAPLFRGVRDGNALVRGSWGAAPVDGLEPQEGDHIVEKMRMNGFFDTRLDILLRGLGADTIVVTGAWTNMSIEHTARHGADAGYEVLVASDGTSTVDDDWQRVALEYAMTNVGVVATCADIAEGLGVTAPASELLLDQAYVGGRWVGADDGATFDVVDPATGETIAAVPRMGAAETRRAIAAAQEAQPAWRAMLARDRARIMRRWADSMLERQEELATLLTREQGKPVAESRVEIAYAASFLEWFGEEAKRVYGDTIPTYAPDRRIVVTKGPVGVTAGITPWNFPAAMPTRKAAPALGAGCTMVLKPAEQTPLTALAVMRLGEEAGLPPGVLSIVTGDASDAPAIGGEMTSNPIVRKLGFTGSTEIGKLLMAQCAGQVKKVSLELGGNAPFIVFDDADLEAAVDGAITCKFRNSGQTCISANRILVQDAVYDAFLERFCERVTRLVVADGFAEGVNVGPLIDGPALEKVVRHVADAREHGADLVLGGEPHERGGQFFSPTVLTGVTDAMAMSSEETFGPVAGISRFDTEAAAVRKANDTPYGLSSYFYSRDMARIWRVSEALEYGILGINTGVISTEVAPFGGVKESGIGREGSKYGMDDWLETKYLCMGGV